MSIEEEIETMRKFREAYPQLEHMIINIAGADGVEMESILVYTEEWRKPLSEFGLPTSFLGLPVTLCRP